MIRSSVLFFGVLAALSMAAAAGCVMATVKSEPEATPFAPVVISHAATTEPVTKPQSYIGVAAGALGCLSAVFARKLAQNG